MELKDFLLCIFDREYDRYPMIRYSFLRCWNVPQIIRILGWTRYHCSTREFQKYIYYSCLDKGVTIEIAEAWFLRSGPTLLKTVKRNNIQDNITKKWNKYRQLVYRNGDQPRLQLNITSSNSEFIFTIKFILHRSLEGEDNYTRWIEIYWRISSKMKPQYIVHSAEKNNFQSLENHTLYFDNGKLTAQGLGYAKDNIELFVKLMTQPISIFKQNFIRSVYDSQGLIIENI